MNRKQWPFMRLAIPLLVIAAFMLTAMAGLFGAPMARAYTPDPIGPAVYVVPVKQTIESGLQSFLERAFKEAGEANAEHIVLVVNTLGGRVDSAESIGELIRSSEIPTTAFIESKAVSAGTYIALNANQIVMQPGSTIGAAAVVNGSGKLLDDPKTISYWVKRMEEAAKLNGRNPDIAAAMVDVNLSLKLSDKIGRDKKSGEILSLSADEAAKLGYTDGTANSVKEVVALLGLDKRMIIEVEPTIAENVARWLVNPIVTTVLLILGIAGVVIELLVPGFGAPGIIGILSFGLYFFGHFVSGFAGMESIVLFVLGFALLVIELFVPSFGILGILGGASLIAGVVIAAPDPMTAFISLIVAVVCAIIIIAIFARTNKGRGIWNKFILRDKLTTEEGFLSAEVKTSLVGLEGVAITPLRPAGTVQIGDERFDVVTAGEFIEANRRVKVTKAEGTWIVVKEIV